MSGYKNAHNAFEDHGDKSRAIQDLELKIEELEKLIKALDARIVALEGA